MVPEVSMSAVDTMTVVDQIDFFGALVASGPNDEVNLWTDDISKIFCGVFLLDI